MKGINEVFVLGRVGQAPELRQLPSGKLVCTFSIATHRQVRDGDGFREETEWIDMKAWDRQAEIAEQHLCKGEPVVIQGRLYTEKWTSADGQPRSKRVVYVRQLTLLPSRPVMPTQAPDQSLPL